MSDVPIVFEELPAKAGILGRVTLNVPATLNSLTLEMVDLLQEKLHQWRDDAKVAAVFIDGTGDKAFCAGGDVQALHRSAVATPGGPCDYAESFFTREYRMNYTLHTYPKPLICWGHGIVMGGRPGSDGRLLPPGGNREYPDRNARGDDSVVPGCGGQLVPEPHARQGGAFSRPHRSVDQCR